MPSLNSPDALACQPGDLSQAEANPPESKTNIHSELIDFFPLFSNKNNKKKHDLVNAEHRRRDLLPGRT